MQTFAQSLIELVISGVVDREVAANAATNRHDFLVALERAEKNAAHDKLEAEARANAARSGSVARRRPARRRLHSRRTVLEPAAPTEQPPARVSPLPCGG